MDLQIDYSLDDLSWALLGSSASDCGWIRFVSSCRLSQVFPVCLIILKAAIAQDKF